jgi:murein DD-endopeptidase MepM/ murein hydrolase activator NlpD
MIKLTAPERGLDSFGSGAYGASRGNHTHRGVDFSALPNSIVHASRGGKVTKLGYPYSDDLDYRYVQVTDAYGLEWRYFYVKPSVAVDDVIRTGDSIGFVQDLDTRYKGITPHVHLEIKDEDGTFINPKSVNF